MAFWTAPLAIDQATGGSGTDAVTDFIGGFFGGNNDPALPEPLQISSRDLGRILDDRPSIANELRSYILQIGFCPDSPDGLNVATCSEIQRSTERLAAQAIYLGNGAPAHSRQGIGEGFGPEEQRVRSIVERAIEAGPESSPWESVGLPWSSGGDGSGGAIMPSSSIVSTVLLVLAVAAVVFVLARRL